MSVQMFKYPIATADSSVVQMTSDAVVRHVAMQGHTICLWAETEADVVPVQREFRVIGTGHVVPDGGTYLGTVADGPFVWHVYEVTP